MTTELATKYSPPEIETEIAALWNAHNAFHAEPSDPGTPYCIVIPPPNVTAALHMGHALNNTLQDILIRYHRMLGENTLWMPGTDHAGIATQAVVEKRVLAEEGKRRTDFPREQFVAKIQAWKDEYEAVITGQLKAMGCSCDWERQRFTMDPICARAVREAFFRLFKDGLIYRGKRLVNWDPATQTALADDEVEMEEIDGHFYYLRYPLLGPPLPSGQNYVTVATTRPETMLGDTAVAINPKDPRAPMLRGRMVLLPIVNRVIPIIEDDYVVLPNPESEDPKARFATGFLKVTPAHDPNDYDIGLRHKLPLINILAPDGSISKDHGWPAEEWNKADHPTNDAEFLLGMDRFEARKAIVAWFKNFEMFEDVKPYRHSVGHSYRSHVPIEPYLSDQWYVKVTDDKLRGAALRAMAPEQRTNSEPGGPPPRSTSNIGVEDDPARWEGKLRFYPERYAKTFETWHENIRDWCISRQLWWGHRIPVWSAPVFAGFSPDLEQFEALLEQWKKEERIAMFGRQRFGVGHNELHEQYDTIFVCVRTDSDSEIVDALERRGFTQDPDVLDTWFSSALWPFSTLAWPEETAELKTWNPGNLLCTAREIITLWVSRMVMTNLYFRGCLPFTDVFIHAMIQDGEGRKMSKSLGNGVDPLDIIHSHGSDAMRYTLAAMTTSTQDVRMPVVRDEATGRNTSPKFDLGRNFTNKLWNAGRFALGNLENPTASAGGLTLPDRWILSRLARTILASDEALKTYDFSAYAQNLYDFFWRDLCDWYIEAVKPTVRENSEQQRVLATCLDAALKLLHPVMPFVTEKLWQRLNEVHRVSEGQLLVTARWPIADEKAIAPGSESAFEVVQQVVSTIRQVRTQQKTPPRQMVDCSVQADAKFAVILTGNRDLIGSLANVNLTAAGPDVKQPERAAAAVIGSAKLFLHDLVDAGAEKQRLTKRLDELSKSIKTLEGRLASKNYTEKAPANLVQQTRDQLANTQREADSVKQQLEAIAD